jgi:hypothetical protein
MSNMSYCRFENTLPDLIDCAYHLDNDASDREQEYRTRFIKVCVEIAIDYGHEVGCDIVECNCNWT